MQKSPDQRQKPGRALVLSVITSLIAAIFLIDTITHRAIAAAVFYTVAILIATSRFKKAEVIVLSVVCITLTLVSSILTNSGLSHAGLVNTGISMSIIGITTYLALRLVTAEAAAHEARDQLLRIARIASLGELTASIAHEVNQPLAGLVTSGDACLRWLRQEPPNIDKARGSVERMIADANRASDVIVRVRRLARSEPSTRQLIDLNEAVAEAVALARSEIERAGVSLCLKLAPGLPRVFADGIQLQQVISNLILNALDAMGEVPSSRRSLDISSDPGEPSGATISIADTGVGLSVAAHQHLFDAFWTTKSDGTGIGLTISRSIVEAHGGRLWVSPNSPAGTIFHLCIPV